MNKTTIIIIACFTFIFRVQAQKTDTAGHPYKAQYSILFGLNQPLVFHGFNVELNYWTKKWVFDYSHGFNLKMDGKMIADEYSDQHVNFKIKHSFGAGIGYRFTEAFNVRFEPKMHVYETYYDGAEKTRDNSIVNFNTYTVGLGAYYRWLPFKNAGNALKGITVAPSIRYWYKVASSLDGNKFDYFNKITGKNETLKAPNIGLNNTPWLANISIGYTF